MFDKATSSLVYDALFLERAGSEVIDYLTEESQPTASFYFVLELVSQMQATVVGSKIDKLYSGHH